MKRYTLPQMLPLYEQWSASGTSKRDFAISQQIRPNTFYYWVKKIEQTSAVPSSGFHRIETAEINADTGHGEIMAAVQYPCGTRLELYSSFQHLNASYTQLLKTLIK